MGWLLLFLFPFQSAMAKPPDWYARVDITENIENVVLEEERVKVVYRYTHTRAIPYVVIPLTYRAYEDGRRLILRAQNKAYNSEGEDVVINIRKRVRKRKFKIKVAEISRKGDARFDTITVTLDKPKLFRAHLKRVITHYNRRRLYFQMGLGMSLLSYSETRPGGGTTDLSETTLTGRTFLKYQLSEKLDLYTGIWANIATLNQPSVEKARFLGMSVRAGYLLPWHVGSMQMNASLGYYFWRMFVTNESYGISQLTGPQLFIGLSPSQGSQSRFSQIYFKFAPIADGFSIKPRNSEIGLGAAYELSTLGQNSWLHATLDLSYFTFSADNLPSASMPTVSLGLSLTL